LRIVIIGGVTAGPKVAARARRLLPDADITIIERGGLISYAGCGLPYVVSGQIRDINQLFITSYGAKRDEQYFANEKAVRVLSRTEATAIDRNKREVALTSLESGETYTIPYDKLVLATGAGPFVPPLPGLELKGVHRLNNPEDARELADQLTAGQEAVIIGAGVAGMAAAAALIKRKLAVSVVEAQEQILPAMLDRDLAALLAYRLEEVGLEMHTGRQVLGLEGDAEGKVTRVTTDQGSLAAELVIIAVGARPNVELARRAGLTIGVTGAVAVNAYLETSDPDIYAVGDCVENRHLVSGQPVYLPLAGTAGKQGRVAGDNLAGRRTTFKGVLGTSVMKIMDWNVACTGLGEDQARSLGYETVCAVNAAHDRAHYFPGHDNIILKLVVDKSSGRLLGAQGVGQGDVVKRIDTAATALFFGGTVDDLASLDLDNAPPYNTPIDPLQETANIVRNKLDGVAATMTAGQLHDLLATGEDFVLLDVRTPEQFKYRYVGDPRVIQLALGELRARLAEIPRDKPVVTICPLGTRAYEAMRILTGAGFRDVRFVEGGLQGWPYDLD